MSELPAKAKRLIELGGKYWEKGQTRKIYMNNMVRWIGHRPLSSSHVVYDVNRETWGARHLDANQVKAALAAITDALGEAPGVDTLIKRRQPRKDYEPLDPSVVAVIDMQYFGFDRSILTSMKHVLRQTEDDWSSPARIVTDAQYAYLNSFVTHIEAAMDAQKEYLALIPEKK